MNSNSFLASSSLDTGSIMTNGLSQHSSVVSNILNDSPYAQSLSKNLKSNGNKLIDKSNLLWKDFRNGIKKRKILIAKMREAALDPNSTSSLLKRYLLEVRQLTLRLVEDSIEIEFRTEVLDKEFKKDNKSSKKKNLSVESLPPLVSNNKEEETKADLYSLVEMINDIDHFYKIESILAMIPADFPSRRNPFILSKSIDQLVDLMPPDSDPGNKDVELKILELLRFKRASRVLIRAESQYRNKLPFSLKDVDRLLQDYNENKIINKLIRAVCTFLHNENMTYNVNNPNDLVCLFESTFEIESHTLLNKLNRFRGNDPMRVDIQTAVRLFLQDVDLESLSENIVASYLIEWINSILSKSLERLHRRRDEVSHSDGSKRNQSPSKFQNYDLESVKLGKLTLSNLIEHNYNDLASEVSSSDFQIKEKSYTEDLPKLKHASRLFLSSPSGATVGTNSRPSTTFTAFNTARSRPGTTVMEPIDEMKPIKEEVIERNQRISFAMAHSDKTRHSIATETMDRPILKKNYSSLDKNILDKDADSDLLFEGSTTHIRSEIRKIISEMGLHKNKKGKGSSVISQDDSKFGDENQEPDTLSSVRYQLLKMQQELLRRKVLDPKHYNIGSVDTLSLENRGLTVIDPNDKSISNSPTKDTTKNENYSLMSELEIARTKEFNRSIEFLYDVVRDKLIAKLNRYPLIDEDKEEYDGGFDNPFYKGVKVTKEIKDKVCYSYCIISKLMFNIYTDQILDTLIDRKTKAKERQKILRVLHEYFEAIANQTPPPEGKLLIKANRVLFSSKFTEDGILVDLVIIRNDECDGIIIHCTPLSGLIIGQVSTGPVTLVVSDKELQVLLINQYGLYLLSKAKWSSMVMVAQWVTTRLRIKRIITTDFEETKSVKFQSTQKNFITEEDVISISSQVTYESDNLNGTKQSDPLAMQKQIVSNTMKSAGNSYNMFGAATKNEKKNLMLMDVKLDRTIEISKALLLQWRSRNVPNISGMDLVLHAWQNLDMVVFSLKIVLPNSKDFNRLIVEEQNEDELADMDSYSDGEENNNGPVEMEFTYRLTSAELSIFGLSEIIENKKVALANTNKDQNHPEYFIYNILIRLKLAFKGSIRAPFHEKCNANDENNWELQYNRCIAREVKTISQAVMVISASAVGGDLLFESDPVDATVYKKVDSKIFSEVELTDIINAEGLSLKLLTAEERKKLAILLMDKLKVVEELSDNSHRLELYSFHETKMLKISLFKGSEQPIFVGNVEINFNLTLSDLRILIRYEIDPQDLPLQFRFLYKGSSCSVKQEAFRRAWDCLPVCLITPKIVETNEIAIETEDIIVRRAKSTKSKKGTISRLVKGQRRVSGKFAAIPIPTLCRVTENTDEIYLLHDGRNLLSAGDIIRIGNILGRDYIVGERSKNDIIDYPRTIKIDPEYNLLDEPDFNIPHNNNFIYPKGAAGYVTFNYKKTYILPTTQSMGFSYEFPDDASGLKTDKLLSTHSFGESLAMKHDTFLLDSSLKSNVSNFTEFDMQSNTVVEGGGSVHLKELLKKSKRNMPANQTYVDCWLWKCIPLSEDKRPKWRQLYDDGSITYSYEFKKSTEYFKHFRVKGMYSHLEVLCTDARCPSLSLYHQRVDEMYTFPLDYYTKLAFNNITSWMPEYKKGIDRTKYLKLLKDISSFPDLKKPARSSQLENLFMKEVKENGIVQKYVTYAGFLRLLREIALLRFPPPVKKEEAKGGDDGSVSSVNDKDDLSSVTTKVDSIASNNSVKSKSSSKKRDSASPSKKKADDKTESKVAEKEIVEIDPEYVNSVLERFVMEFVMMYPDWYDITWREAKLLAMKKESVPYCAATRIEAMVRGNIWKARFVFFKRQLIVLQSLVRRKLSSNKTKAYIKILMKDWIFRQRYHSATRIQCLLRRFLKRCWYSRVMEKIRLQEVQVQKARRFRMKKIRMARKKYIIYKEATRVNGVTCYIKMMKKDTRNYSQNFGVNIEVYTPYDQKLYIFPLEEEELRMYMQLALGVEVLSLGDLMDVRNLKRVVSARIIVYKATSKMSSQNVIFSKHALGQRGEKALTRGKRINGDFFVCKIFETGDDITVQSYHRLSCKVFNSTITMQELRKWISDEFMEVKEVDELKLHEEPILLRPGNKKMLHEWLLRNLAVDTRNGKFKVAYKCHIQKSRKMDSIIKIQSMFRKALARPKIVIKLDELMLKVRVSSTDSTVYYLNRKTGASSWEKPALLGVFDLTTEPTRRWVEVSYEYNGALLKHFVNPYSGKYTTYTVDKAARKVQAMARNFLLKAISMPLPQFVKAGSIYKNAVTQYEINRKKLASVINYALVLHAIVLDEDLARSIYAESVELSEANPLVTRAFGIFLIGTCDSPIALNRERASTLISDAARKDETNIKFEVAYYLFKFACLRRPNDYRTLINLALVHCLIFKENYKAEKLLRRALSIAPFEDRVLEIWKLLKERFPERQLLYNPQSRVHKANMHKNTKKRIIHGRPVVENINWAGWVFVPDDEFGVSKQFSKGASYWYNPADGKEQIESPNFAIQWIIRKKRSLYQEEVDGIEQYYDPLTSEHFQYHLLTDSFA